MVAPMTRSLVNLERLKAFLERFGRDCRGPGTVFIVGGGSAVLHGWRNTTVDVDLKLDPEPTGAFELIARLKDELSINVELASPDQFIPPPAGWRDRSVFIARYGKVDFFHFDFYAQALAKIERGSERDLTDVEAMVSAKLLKLDKLREAFEGIQPQLVRYPGIDAGAFRAKFEAVASSLQLMETSQ